MNQSLRPANPLPERCLMACCLSASGIFLLCLLRGAREKNCSVLAQKKENDFLCNCICMFCPSHCFLRTPCHLSRARYPLASSPVFCKRADFHKDSALRFE